MKYISIDLETTGLNPATCDVVEFGAVLADTNSLDTPVQDLSTFHAYILPPNGNYRGEPYALSMHPVIFRRIAKREEGFYYLHPQQVVNAFGKWITACGVKPKLTVAGKNVGSFDIPFIAANLPGVADMFSHRVFDPGSMFFDPRVDQKIPDLQQCLRRSGIDSEVSHTAIEDAQDVIRCLNFFWKNYPDK